MMKHSLFVVFVMSVFVPWVRADAAASAPAGAPHEVRAVDDLGLEDKPIEGFRLQLLEIAFKTASSFSLDPYIKDRSVRQAKTVEACLALDQPARALRYTGEIVNWRRGAAYAAVAYYLAEKGQTEHVDELLVLALRHSGGDGEWRQARVKTAVAQTKALLGQLKVARKVMDEDEDPSAEGALVQAQAKALDEDRFDELAEVLDKLIATQGYDQIVSALFGYAGLYARYFEDPTRRDMIEHKIKSAWKPIPGIIRFRVLLALAEAALSHDANDHCLRLLDDDQSLRNGFRWRPDTDVTMRAELAALRFRAGQKEQARQALADALELFHAQREKISNADRPEAVRPGTIRRALRRRKSIQLVRVHPGTVNTKASKSLIP
jgi:tetratricopeptide (TPR) repeat protein